MITFAENFESFAMRTILLLVVLFFTLEISAEDWGKTGHRVTGEIAEQHLSKKAKRTIKKILKGKSLAWVSTYGDDIKSDPKYREYGPWHYVNLDPEQQEYEASNAAEEGDIIQGIEKSIEALKDPTTPIEDQEFYLKMLVHLVGDLHQPLHAGRSEDKGGNDLQVRWFNRGTNIHRVWDSHMIDDFQMSYTELAANSRSLSKEEEKQIASGDLLTWLYESRALSDEIYASVEIGEKLGYSYSYEWFPVVREQLQKGGIRLSRLLNQIYK